MIVCHIYIRHCAVYPFVSLSFKCVFNGQPIYDTIFYFLYMTHIMQYSLKKFFGAMLYAYMEFSLLVAQNAHENASKKKMVFHVNGWYY